MVNWKIWNDKTNADFAEKYQSIKTSELAKYYNVSISSIHLRASKLGVRKHDGNMIRNTRITLKLFVDDEQQRKAVVYRTKIEETTTALVVAMPTSFVPFLTVSPK